LFREWHWRDGTFPASKITDFSNFRKGEDWKVLSNGENLLSKAIQSAKYKIPRRSVPLQVPESVQAEEV